MEVGSRRIEDTLTSYRCSFSLQYIYDHADQFIPKSPAVWGVDRGTNSTHAFYSANSGINLDYLWSEPEATKKEKEKKFVLRGTLYPAILSVDRC